MEKFDVVVFDGYISSTKDVTDTDILCLLLHHLYILRDHSHTYLKNMSCKNDT